MADFNKKLKNIEISNLNTKEIISILKINIPCVLSFEKSGEVLETIQLGARLEKNGTNMIQISTLLETNSIIGYDELFQMLGENMKTMKLKILVDFAQFQEKEPLLLMLDDLKQEIVNSCVYIDYNSKKHIFSVINKKTKGLSSSIYYFEDNNSILAFTEEGPALLYDKTQSVEDLICE